MEAGNLMVIVVGFRISTPNGVPKMQCYGLGPGKLKVVERIGPRIPGPWNFLPMRASGSATM